MHAAVTTATLCINKMSLSIPISMQNEIHIRKRAPCAALQLRSDCNIVAHNLREDSRDIQTKF